MLSLFFSALTKMVAFTTDTVNFVVGRCQDVMTNPPPIYTMAGDGDEDFCDQIIGETPLEE